MAVVEEDASTDDFLRHIKARVGRTLCNKYVLEGVLGVGGMASVYRGKHRNGNRVAIKMLHTELSISREIRERFLREGYVANQVDHPGAVRVLDDDIAEDDAPFLVMELLEGETLEEHLVGSGGTISARAVLPVTVQLLEVLVAAHEKGIVHRDIKPENIFLTRRDRSLKVLDFGIARLNDGRAQATRTGRVMGTPVYMAPEQARGETKRIDGRTDVWAAAATAYRALTGRYVYEAATPEMVIVHAATQQPRALAEALPGVHPRLAEIIDRGLAWNIDDRWTSAHAMLTALEELAPGALSDLREAEPSLPRTLDMTRPLLQRPSPPPLGDATAGKTQRAVLRRGPSLPTFDDETELATPFAPGLLRPYAPSTTAGLAGQHAAPQLATRSASRLAAVLGVLACAALLLGAAAVKSGVLDRREASAAGTASGIAAVAPSSVPTAIPESDATTPAVQPQGGIALGASVEAGTVPARAPAPPAARTTVRNPATGLVAAEPSPPARPAPPASCDPPWQLDAQGVKTYKMECFKK